MDRFFGRVKRKYIKKYNMEELYEQMLAHRFSEALVQDIFFHNLHRFLGEAL